MFDIVKNILSVVLGFSSGSSVANKVSGAVNYALLLPIATWIWFNKADTLIFQIVFNYKGKLETITLFETTIGGLSVIVGAIFIYLEFLRRSNSSTIIRPIIPPTSNISPNP